MILSDDLQLPNIAHGFFTREGGYSSGIFASLNCGLGSGDDIEVVKKNRAIVAGKVKVVPDHLVSAYQVHGTDVAVVEKPFAERPKADGLVTNKRGLALGILTADCGPVLFADAQGHSIGACHAGWKGALHGVYQTTITEMEKLGSKREDVVAVLGPTISQAAYEVGPEFIAIFKAHDRDFLKYFIPSVKQSHHMFDLPRFLVDQMKAFGIGKVVDLGLCTYADEQRFFSYRRATHRAEKDYGRLHFGDCFGVRYAAVIVGLMLAACTSNPLQLAKDAPQPVTDQSLVRPPWEALVKAPPGAQNDLDLETLNGPQATAPEPVPPPPVAATQPPVLADAPPKKPNKNATTIKAVAVLNVTGASAQANAELTQAMRKVLRDAGWPVLSAPRKDALSIRGTVALDAAQGNSQGVHIHWLVAEPKGKALGDIAQNNQVAAHSLDGAWGQTAGFAAQAAADGIFKLIARFR